MDKRDKHLESIINYLKDQRKLDFSGYYPSTLMRRIEKRIAYTDCSSLKDYYEYLIENPGETDQLLEVLTINVSQFFRNPYVFEYLGRFLIPELILKKAKSKDKLLRIWSAGCSTGEEPYTIAILIHNFLEKESIDLNLSIFATDIDKKSLGYAKKGLYDYDSIRDVRISVLKDYFNELDNKYQLNQEVINSVNFSYYDLLDENSTVPPESIFGDFDLVLCRNVLIYYTRDYQKFIFKKLARSLKKGAYLVLGEAELPVHGYKQLFVRDNGYFKIFRKDDYIR